MTMDDTNLFDDAVITFDALDVFWDGGTLIHLIAHDPDGFYGRTFGSIWRAL